MLGNDWVPICLWSHLLHLHLVIARISFTTKMSATIWHSMACMPQCIGCTLRAVPDLRTSDHVHHQFLYTSGTGDSVLQYVEDILFQSMED